MAKPPYQLSRELRKGEDAELTRRRWIVGLSFVGAAMGQIVGLYQMGILRRLPDFPTRYTDASRVDASDYAYRRLQTPDGLMMVATYAVTAILAGAGGRDRARSYPVLPLALAGKTLYDSIVCLRLAREEWRENRAFCSFCQTATAASLASLALALPEAIRAGGLLTDRWRSPRRWG
ncbi:MAG: vitamin K epoxide reductase family protein [Pararhizobium sp.]